MISERTAVYHLFDASGCRLYIGMTNDLSRRLTQHSAKDWWPLVDQRSTEVVWHPSRDEARREEARQIALHRPPHNDVVVGPQRIVNGPVAWDATVSNIDWDAEIDRILAADSPAARARLAGVALGALSAEQVELKWQRQACVAEMRRSMSLSDIGKEIGLHRNRVQQIAEGRSSGGQGGRTAAASGDE